MPNDVCFSYRLPLTYVRVTGTRTETTDIDDKITLDCKSAVTTEIGADPRSRYPVRLATRRGKSQNATWSMTSDGRVTGADVSTTVAHFQGVSAALQAGSTVLGVAGPALVPAGPIGWAALAGVVGAVGVGAGILARGHTELFRGVIADEGQLGRGRQEPPEPPSYAEPAEWGVHPRYVEAHSQDATELANVRATLVTTARDHARAAYAASMASDDDRVYWESRMAQLQWLLTATTVAATRAETAYADWVAATTKSSTSGFDFRFSVDELPSAGDLHAWVSRADSTTVHHPWSDLVDQLQVAVTIDMERINGDNDVDVSEEYTAVESADTVHYRPPRPATLQVWRVSASPQGTGHALELVETQRANICRPGNETQISINTDPRDTNAVTVGFDDFGALTKVTSDLKDPVEQRSSDLGGLLSKIHDGVTSGQDIRAAISPPSYVDRAAEAKAKAELGLVPQKEDPLKELKDQVAEQQLRAQLKLAQQMQSASSIPVFVSVTQTT